MTGRGRTGRPRKGRPLKRRRRLRGATASEIVDVDDAGEEGIFHAPLDGVCEGPPDSPAQYRAVCCGAGEGGVGLRGAGDRCGHGHIIVGDGGGGGRGDNVEHGLAALCEHLGKIEGVAPEGAEGHACAACVEQGVGGRAANAHHCLGVEAGCNVIVCGIWVAGDVDETRFAAGQEGCFGVEWGGMQDVIDNAVAAVHTLQTSAVVPAQAACDNAAIRPVLECIPRHVSNKSVGFFFWFALGLYVVYL